MKSVLFIKPPMRYGKFYFRIAQYIEYFKKNDWEINVLYPAPDGATLVQKLSAADIFYKACHLLAQFPKFLVDLAKCDLVIVFPSPTMVLYAVWVGLFQKKMLIEHTVSYISHRDVWPWYPVWLDRLLYRQSAAVMTHTESMRESLVKQFKLPGRQVVASYCNVDLEKFSPRYDNEVLSLKKKLGILSKKVVFYHGLMHEWHGVDLILEAANRVSQKHSDVVFVFMTGVSDIFNGLPDYILHLNERDYYTWETLPVFIQLADIWVSGFRNVQRGDQTFGSTLIQALAMGRTVITSDSPEKRKFLRNQENALLVKSESASAIEEGILYCLSHESESKRLGAEARKIAERSFSIQALEEKLDQLSAHNSDRAIKESQQKVFAP